MKKTKIYLLISFCILLSFQSFISPISAVELDIDPFKVDSVNYTGSNTDAINIIYSTPVIKEVSSLGIIQTSGEDTDSALITYRAEVKTETTVSINTEFALSDFLGYDYHDTNAEWFTLNVNNYRDEYGEWMYLGVYPLFCTIATPLIRYVSEASLSGDIDIDIRFNPSEKTINNGRGTISVNDVSLTSESVSIIKSSETEKYFGQSSIVYDTIDTSEFIVPSNIMIMMNTFIYHGIYGAYIAPTDPVTYTPKVVENILQSSEYVEVLAGHDISSPSFADNQARCSIPVGLAPEISTQKALLTVDHMRYSQFSASTGFQTYINHILVYSQDYLDSHYSTDNSAYSQEVDVQTNLRQAGIEYVIETTHFVEMPIQLSGISYEDFINDEVYRDGNILLEQSLGITDIEDIEGPESVIGTSSFMICIISLAAISAIIMKRKSESELIA